MKTISIVVPVYNEENLTDELVRRLVNLDLGNYNKEIIFVNDGSKDNTLPQLILEQYRHPDIIKVVDLSRNFGHQLAITAGMDLASGDAIVTIDGDLQDPPELIPAFIKKWEEGYEVVHGIRNKRDGESWFKLFTAKIFYRLLSKLSDTKIPLDTGDFKLIDKKVGDALREIRENSRYIRGIISWIGFKSTGVQYDREKRHAGKTKFSLYKMMKFSVDGILSFSTRPLYISILLGMFFSLFSFLWIIYIFINYMAGNLISVTGWASIIIAVLMVGGFNLMFIGVIGIYIGRIFRESQKRPLYIVNTIYQKQ